MPFPVFQLGGRAAPGIVFGVGSAWRGASLAADPSTGICRELVEAVKSAVHVGFRSFDAAEFYKNEVSLGVGLEESGVRRDELFITTKLAPGLADVASAMAQQLKMLRTSYVDVLSIHTPLVLKEQGDFLRAWRQMEPMADKGYARHLGLSNFDPHHLEEFIDSTRIRPAVNQLPLYPYILPQATLALQYAKEQNIVFQSYEIASSIVRATEQNGPLDPVLDSIAAQLSTPLLQVTPGQVLLAWASAKGTMCITTSSKQSRMAEYIAAGDVVLSSTHMTRIDAAGLEGAAQGRGVYWTWTARKWP